MGWGERKRKAVVYLYRLCKRRASVERKIKYKMCA